MSTAANTASHAESAPPSVTGTEPHVGIRVGLALVLVAITACAVAAYPYPVSDLAQVQTVGP